MFDISTGILRDGGGFMATTPKNDLKNDPKNDPKNPVTQFCLAMEEHRRTAEGRVRTSRELLDQLFAQSPTGAVDRVFVHVPPAVRGPIVAAWGIRGIKSALRDPDDKIRRVVEDALAAGDLDDVAFENGLSANVLVDWLPLPEWWAFWRSGKLTGVATQKALATGRALGLFDDRWFLDNVEGRGGKLKGTTTLCDTLSKDQIVAWLRAVHDSGDGSPAGLVAALGWDVVLARAAQEALLFALDAFAKRIGLAPDRAGATADADAIDTTNTEMPGELEPPSIDSFFNSGTAPPAVVEARDAMMASIAEESTPSAPAIGPGVFAGGDRPPRSK
jgi:hypothetical protein